MSQVSLSTFAAAFFNCNKVVVEVVVVDKHRVLKQRNSLITRVEFNCNQTANSRFYKNLLKDFYQNCIRVAKRIVC